MAALFRIRRCRLSGLPDQAARDRFTTALDHNVCISASAGAGKTRAIVDRVEALIRRAVTDPQQDPMDRLVVVTYGEMAAQELKVRCRERLLSATDAPHIKNGLLARFNRAYFGTIHSFCLRLLRDYGSHLGLPGQVRLLSSQDSLFFERFKQGLDLESINWPQQRCRTALKYYSLEEIFAIAEKLQAEQVEHYLKARDRVLSVPDVSPLMEYPLTKRNVNTVGRIQQNLQRWLADVAEDRPFLYLPKVTAGGRDFVADGKALLEPYQEWLAESAVIMAAHIAEAYRQHRLEQMRLTYDDMISETVRLARDPETLDQMRRRGWIIILDEAQDTDASMFQILTEITRPAGTAFGDWPQHEQAPGPEAGQFSFVGDDQQCIYSSRADIGKYLDYVQAYEQGRAGERLEFSVTMRCPEPVVSAVNQIFPGRVKQSRAEFRTMKASPLKETPGAAVVRLPMELELEEKASDKRIFEQECREVAAWLHAQGLAGLGVKEWSDVAVLCPRVGWLAAAGEVFEATGIPVAHKSTRQLAADRPLYTWPYALLHVMAYPFDRFELIGVLRDIFVIPDAEIERAHREDPLGLSLFSAPHARGELADTLSFLEQGHVTLFGRQKESSPVPLARAVRQWVEVSQLDERLVAVGEETEGLSRFFQSIETASAAGLTLMDWLEEERQKLEEPSSPVATMGGLDLISCHKSKGLEWPVVVLVGMWRKIYQRPPSYPSVHRQGDQIRVMVNGDSAGQEWKARMEQLRHEELQRLLYVAMTRSRQTLVISDPEVEGKPSNFGELIGWHDVRNQFGSELPAPVPVSADEPTEIILPPVDCKQRAAFAEWAHHVPQRLLPHALSEEEDLPERFPDVGGEQEEPGVGGVEYGSVWHEWVEHLPWAEGRQACETYLVASLEARRLGGMSPALRQRLGTEAEVLFKSQTFEQILAPGQRVMPELPFLWPMSPEQWMEGVIDLVVIRTEGDWWVIDWKTNRKYEKETEDAFADRMADHYRAQLEAYAQACSQQVGQGVTRRGLYLTTTGRYIELS